MERTEGLWNRIGEGWERYRDGILLWLGVFVVGILAFQGGFLYGQSFQAKPLIIEKPIAAAPSQPDVKPEGTVSGVQETKVPDEKPTAQTTAVQGATTSAADPADEKTTSTLCKFVGSRNSDKYHTPSSGCAKRIKPENKVCFASVEDAQARGYKEGCLK